MRISQNVTPWRLSRRFTTTQGIAHTDMNMRPSEYEVALLQHLRQEFSNHLFSVAGTEDGRQHKIPGRYSLVNRQVDVAVYRQSNPSPILMADAKHYRKRIDVKAVECFIGMVDDVGADVGLLVAPRGFTAAAKQRARSRHGT
jgi:Restriction endonuclease